MELGMNPNEVEALGTQLKAVAQEIHEIVGQLNGQIDATVWQGADATRFKTDWWPRHRGSLSRVAIDLDGFGQSALNNASEQRQISGTGAAGGAGAGIPSGHAPNPLLHHGARALDALTLGADTIEVGTWVLPGIVGDAGQRAFWSQQILDGDSMPFIPGGTNPLYGQHGSMVLDGVEHVGQGLDLINGFVHGYEFGDAIADHGLISDQAARAGIDVGWDIAGAAVPQVGLGKAAWDVGWEIGEFASDQFVDTGALVDDAMVRHYGTTDLTVQQATEFSHRYDGWSGFGNFVTDSAGSAVDSARDFAGSAVSFINPFD